MQTIKNFFLYIFLLTVIFACNNNYRSVNIEIKPEEGGSASPVGKLFAEGDVVKLEAIANPGWEFVGWEGDVESSHRTIYLFMSKNYQISALFEQLEADELLYDEESVGSVHDIDGNRYRTVIIGDQEWMAENLRTTRYANGDGILNITDGIDWSAKRRGAWVYYDNDASYGRKFGKLYNWYAVDDSRGLCPEGWRIPDNQDWSELSNFLGFNDGGKMKVSGTRFWRHPNRGATNASGFSGLPGGSRYGTGTFFGVYESGGWWSATHNEIDIAWRRYLHFNSEFVIRYYGDKRNGFSVRCIR